MLHHDWAGLEVIDKAKRLLREEGGFTLAEMLVTIMIMLTVLFALYSIFDMSIRVFSFGNDKTEAVENARLGLERMEREIRAAYPYDKTANNNTLLANRTSTSITFGNDLDGNRKIECLPDAPSSSPPPPPCETVSYDVYQPDGQTTYSLGRVNTNGGNRQSVIEFVNYIDASNTGLNFRYFERNGTTEVLPGGNESQIALVRIELRIRVDDGAQTLTTDVALRNRGN